MALCVNSPEFLDISCVFYFYSSSLVSFVTSKRKYHSGKDTSVLSVVEEKQEHTKNSSEKCKASLNSLQMKFFTQQIGVIIRTPTVHILG